MNNFKKWLFKLFKIRTLEDLTEDSERIIKGLEKGERLKKGDYIILSGKYAPGFWVDSVGEELNGGVYYGLIPDDLRANLSGYTCDEDGLYYFFAESAHRSLMFVER